MRPLGALGLALAVAAGPAAAQFPAPVSPQAAINHVGQSVVVCGQIASANFVAGKAVLLAVDTPYPGQAFSLLIRPIDRAKFGAPELSLLGKRVCSGGTIVLAQGRAQMILADPKQLTSQ
jgi:hypothetical protein